MDALTELATGDWLEERHDGTPDRCVFCYGEADNGKVNHKPTCPQLVAATELAGTKQTITFLHSGVEKLQAALDARTDECSALRAKLELCEEQLRKVEA
jgi:hypothetical protein